MNKNAFVISILLFMASNTFANVCLRATNITELKRDFPVIVVGKVTKKELVTEATHAYMLEVEPVSYIKGHSTEHLFKSLTFEKFPISERPVYEVGKLYIFPVDVHKNKKNEITYKFVLPSQECKIFPLSDSSKNNKVDLDELRRH